MEGQENHKQELNRVSKLNQFSKNMATSFLRCSHEKIWFRESEKSGQEMRQILPESIQRPKISRAFKTPDPTL